VNQTMALAQAGSELVRVTVNTEAAAQAVPKIVETLDKFGVRVPIIGDFHYNGTSCSRNIRTAHARW